MLGPDVLRWVLGGSFIAMAVWMLIPDKLDEGDGDAATRFGVFGTTLIAFFLAEMGDKTQIATVALSARYMDATIGVVMGTTMGMMIANVPAVLLGEVAARKVALLLDAGAEVRVVAPELGTTLAGEHAVERVRVRDPQLVRARPRVHVEQDRAERAARRTDVECILLRQRLPVTLVVGAITAFFLWFIGAKLTIFTN